MGLIFIFRGVIVKLVNMILWFFFLLLFVFLGFRFFIFLALLLLNLFIFWANRIVKRSHCKIIFISIVIFIIDSLSLDDINFLNLFILIVTLIIVITFSVFLFFHHLVKLFTIVALILVDKNTSIFISILSFLQVVLYLLEFLAWVLDSISCFQHFKFSFY